MSFLDFFSPEAAAVKNLLPTEVTCPPSTTITSMTSQLDDLDRTWVTTGFYTWQEMAEVVAATVKLAGAASDAAIAFFSGNSTPGMKDYVRAAADKYRDVSRKAIDYTEIWKKAKATGVEAINAPGLRKWVIDDLRAAIALMRAIEVSQCGAPWWLGTVVGLASFFNAVVSVAKSIGKLVAKVGQIVLDAADTALGLWPVLKWSAIGIGAVFLGVFVWGKLQKTAEASQKPFSLPKFKLPKLFPSKSETSHG